MKPSCLAIGLVQPDGKIVQTLQVVEDVLWRMARRVQGSTRSANLARRCQVELALTPQRGLPLVASALEFRLSWGAGATLEQTVVQVPVTALEPLVSGMAAQYRAAAALPLEMSLSYLVLRPPELAAGMVFSGILPPFESQPGDPAANTSVLFPDYDCASDVMVVVTPAVLESCAAWCRDDVVEKGGVLLGQVYRSPAGLWVEVLAFAPAQGASADATHLSFTLEAWRSIEHCRAALARQWNLSGKLQVVGWAHSHPRLEGNGYNPFFLSVQDVNTTAQHFREPYAVALVLDAQASPDTPAAAGLAAFGWDEYGVSLVPRSLSLREPAPQLYLAQEA